jgi:S1-C subfamily serine protease
MHLPSHSPGDRRGLSPTGLRFSRPSVYPRLGNCSIPAPMKTVLCRLARPGIPFGKRFLRGLVMVLILLNHRPAFGLGTDAMQAMVIVEGDEGRGSAFLVRMEGMVYLVTNSHVICGNKNVKFKTLDNRELSTGPLQIADSADLVRAEVKDVKAGEALGYIAKVERNLKIGDQISVTGNAEGGGVVREILGRVKGIGPDRIEVDAPFVPGNSGSPILLQSTGQVVGVATYYTAPPKIRAHPKDKDAKSDPSVSSLNEVRRFGYRLDSVAKWVAPSEADGIMKQGVKLTQIGETTLALFVILNAGPAKLASLPPGQFLSKQDTQDDDNLAALRKAVDKFTKRMPNQHSPEHQKKVIAEFYAALVPVVVNDVHDVTPDQFSGYFATQFKEELAQRAVLGEWIDTIAARTAQAAGLHSNTAAAEGKPAPSAPPPPPPAGASSVPAGAPPSAPTPPEPKVAQETDPGPVKLVLSQRVDSKLPPASRHLVSFPAESKPGNTADMFWIVKDPAQQVHKVPVKDTTALSVATPVNGLYIVSVEHWKPRKKKPVAKQVISNAVEITVSDIPPAPTGASPPATPPGTTAPAN